MELIPEIEALIYDRTGADVVYADGLAERVKLNGISSLSPAEQSEWFGGLRGRYTITDLNRVETAVQALSDVLRTYGYTATVATKTTWDYPDIPSPAEMSRYLGNVETLVRASFVLPTTPELPPDMEHLTFGGANDIERVLFDIWSLISSVSDAFIYSGEIHSGEF